MSASTAPHASLVCPVTAIFTEDDIPGEWKPFTAINAEFFADTVSGLGTPGGAAQVEVPTVDHPTVAGWETYLGASASRVSVTREASHDRYL